MMAAWIREPRSEWMQGGDVQGDLLKRRWRVRDSKTNGAMRDEWGSDISQAGRPQKQMGVRSQRPGAEPRPAHSH